MIFSLFRKRHSNVIDQNDSLEIKELLKRLELNFSQLHLTVDNRMKELDNRIFHLEHAIKNLEKNFNHKELLDKQNYGRLVYRLQEISDKENIIDFDEAKKGLKRDPRPDN